MEIAGGKASSFMCRLLDLSFFSVVLWLMKSR